MRLALRSNGIHRSPPGRRQPCAETWWLCGNVLRRPRRVRVAARVRLLIPNPELRGQLGPLQPLPLWPHDGRNTMKDRVLQPELRLTRALRIVPHHLPRHTSLALLHDARHPRERGDVELLPPVPRSELLCQSALALLRHQKCLEGGVVGVAQPCGVMRDVFYLPVARVCSTLLREVPAIEVVPAARMRVAELVERLTLRVPLAVILLNVLVEAVSVPLGLRNVSADLPLRHGVDVGYVRHAPRGRVALVGGIVRVLEVLPSVIHEPGPHEHSPGRDLGSNLELVPILHPQCLRLCRIPLCLIFWRVDILDGDIGTASPDGKRAFEAPVAAASITAMGSVNLPDVAVERGELGLFEKVGKRRGFRRGHGRRQDEGMVFVTRRGSRGIFRVYNQDMLFFFSLL